MNPTSPSSFLHDLLLLLLLLLLSFPPFLSGQSSSNYTATVITTLCGQTQSSNPESFDQVFVNTFEIIYQNVTSNGFGDASSTTGNITVYGLGQCFSYLSSTDCQLCYAMSRVKLPHCLPATDSRIFLDDCFLRYADHDVSFAAVDANDTASCGNSSAPTSTLTQFNATATALLANLTTAAYGVKGYYSAGSAAVPGSSVTLYGMAQCWKSLNASGCRECMESARESALRCLPAVDGKAMNAGCFVRYSTDPFYMTSGGGGGSSSVWRKVVIALGSLIGTLAIVAAFFLWKKRSNTDPSDDLDGSAEIIQTISASNLSFKYEELRNATENFSQMNKLGQGGFGSVYRGVLPDGREIAVKRLFFNTRQWVDQFFNEVRLVSQVQHKNLVKLLGCSVEGPESLLVYEFLCNTSLDHFLFDAFKKISLDWERRFDIILGTAEGLSYLHSASEIRIIHRDIKASNILLDERFKPKIADFGLARYFTEGQSHLSTGLAGTFGYMAPEYIVHGQLTEKADIYSYGVLVLEIVTGRKNHDSVAASDDGRSLMSLIWQHFNSGTLMGLMDPCLENQCSPDEAVRVFQVGLLCAQASPNLRPPMWKVVEMLNSRSKELPQPTQPPFIDVKGSNAKRSDSSESSSLLSSSENKTPFSLNQLSISATHPR